MDVKPNLNENECSCDGSRSINYVSNIFIRLEFAFEFFFQKTVLILNTVPILIKGLKLVKY